jgi:hypothetical protein
MTRDKFHDKTFILRDSCRNLKDSSLSGANQVDPGRYTRSEDKCLMVPDFDGASKPGFLCECQHEAIGIGPGLINGSGNGRDSGLTR